jgi:multicomponent K+:H+ antiporter subunit G
MSWTHELIVSLLIVIGATFALIGSWGLVKLPDLMSRLHAPTKSTTLGVGGALVASMIYFMALEGKISIHELLISLFLFLTAPITAHFLGKAYLHHYVDPDKSLPQARGKYGWSTFVAAPEEESDAK